MMKKVNIQSQEGQLIARLPLVPTICNTCCSLFWVLWFCRTGQSQDNWGHCQEWRWCWWRLWEEWLLYCQDYQACKASSHSENSYNNNTIFTRSTLKYFEILPSSASTQLNSTQLNFNFNWGWDSFISSFRQATRPPTRPPGHPATHPPVEVVRWCNLRLSLNSTQLQLQLRLR